jgi:hypothetical protein
MVPIPAAATNRKSNEKLVRIRATNRFDKTSAPSQSIVYIIYASDSRHSKTSVAEKIAL